jgi:HSP20 family protein
MKTELETTDTSKVSASSKRWQRPSYDVRESDDAFSIRVSLPGVEREQVDISIEKDTLTVTGRRDRAIPEGWHPLRREIADGDFRLGLRLNVPVNESKIKACVENGLLDLTLPKAEEVKPRKIKIS